MFAVQPTADPVLDDDLTPASGADPRDGEAPRTGRASAGVEPEERPEFLPGIAVPLPDEAAILAAWERLSAIDIGVSAPTIAGLGMLAEPVAFIAGVQAHPYPRPILSTRVVHVTGSHAGGLATGSVTDPRDSVPLQQLAAGAGAGIVTLQWEPAAGAIEVADAISSRQLDAAMRSGWAEAERAADEGIELLILAAGGAGQSAAAVAVLSAISGYETSALLGRAVTPAGVYDDNAWMARAIALRDAMHRVRHRDGDPRTVLCALGGADLAAATGLLLGAASRRLPVMIDGPVGAAAAMLANDFAPFIRRWIMLPDSGRNVAVIVAAEALELRPWIDMCLDLSEGATSLSALPLLQMALTLAGAGTPVEPGLPRLDASPVYVGVARPVEPAEEGEEVEEPQERPAPSAALTAPTTSIGEKAKATARPAPPKPTPPKAAPKAAKAAAAKAKGAGGRSGPARSGPAKATGAPKAGGRTASGPRPAANAASAARTAGAVKPADAARPADADQRAGAIGEDQAVPTPSAMTSAGTRDTSTVAEDSTVDHASADGAATSGAEAGGAEAGSAAPRPRKRP